MLRALGATHSNVDGSNFPKLWRRTKWLLPRVSALFATSRTSTNGANGGCSEKLRGGLSVPFVQEWLCLDLFRAVSIDGAPQLKGVRVRSNVVSKGVTAPCKCASKHVSAGVGVVGAALELLLESHVGATHP